MGKRFSFSTKGFLHDRNAFVIYSAASGTAVEMEPKQPAGPAGAAVQDENI